MKRLNLTMRERYIFSYRAARRFGWPPFKAFRKAISMAVDSSIRTVADIII